MSQDAFDELGLQETVSWSRRWEKEDTRDVEHLRVGAPMGSGAFGTAWLVQHRTTNAVYALKAMEKERASRGQWKDVLMREKDIMASVPPHSHVITLFNTFQARERASERERARESVRVCVCVRRRCGSAHEGYSPVLAHALPICRRTRTRCTC